MKYLTLNPLITRSNHCVYIIIVILMDIQNFIILHPLFISDATNGWEEFLIRHCPKFSAINDPGNYNQVK